MNKFRSLLLIAMLVNTLLASGQDKKQTGAKFTWEKATHDFGDILQGDKVEHTFKFTNTGDKELIITNVEVTCGCTTPKGWPRDPIPPGGSGEITIAFNSTGKIGKQNKVITITSNALGTVNQVMFIASVLQRTSN
jgi:hypothetical protein